MNNLDWHIYCLCPFMFVNKADFKYNSFFIKANNFFLKVEQ